jgi:hypothetical protein
MADTYYDDATGEWRPIEAYDHAAWTEAKARRRAGLVDKKHNAYLEAKEQAEFERLQAEFGAWQDENFPLPEVE